MFNVRCSDPVTKVLAPEHPTSNIQHRTLNGDWEQEAEAEQEQEQEQESGRGGATRADTRTDYPARHALFEADLFALTIEGGLVNAQNGGGVNEGGGLGQDFAQVDFLEFVE